MDWLSTCCPHTPQNSAPVSADGFVSISYLSSPGSLLLILRLSLGGLPWARWGWEPGHTPFCLLMGLFPAPQNWTISRMLASILITILSPAFGSETISSANIYWRITGMFQEIILMCEGFPMYSFSAFPLLCLKLTHSDEEPASCVSYHSLLQVWESQPLKPRSSLLQILGLSAYPGLNQPAVGWSLITVSWILT